MLGMRPSCSMSGPGLEAQRAAVAGPCLRRPARLLAKFTEVESGRKTHRPELARALVEARARRPSSRSSIACGPEMRAGE
jgi:hypothetical protein